MRAFWITALLVLAIDQASKIIVVHWMGLSRLGAIDVFPPYLNFRMGWNRGVNFGLFAHDAEAARWLLIALALAVSAWLAWWALARLERPAHRALAGAIVGGALGNVIDRLAYGAVADFLNMSCCGIVNPYAFNIADIAIFAGAIGLVVWPGETKNG
jgi:signal peptidase II